MVEFTGNCLCLEGFLCSWMTRAQFRKCIIKYLWGKKRLLQRRSPTLMPMPLKDNISCVLTDDLPCFPLLSYNTVRCVLLRKYLWDKHCSQVLWRHTCHWQDWVTVSEEGSWSIQTQFVWVGCECSTILWFTSKLCSLLCCSETTRPSYGAGLATWRTVSLFCNVCKRPTTHCWEKKIVCDDIIIWCGGVRSKPKSIHSDYWETRIMYIIMRNQLFNNSKWIVKKNM